MAKNSPSPLQAPSYTASPVPPTFFAHLSAGHQKILWVGCSDSWITETDGLGAEREQFFVHRNLGSVVSNEDLSSGSALEFCIGVLEVEHIVICGHYDCALVTANNREPNALNGWCSDLRNLHKANEAQLRDHGTPMTEAERNRQLMEVYILKEAEWVRRQPLVAKAIKEGKLQVQGFVFDKKRRGCVVLSGGS